MTASLQPGGDFSIGGIQVGPVFAKVEIGYMKYAHCFPGDILSVVCGGVGSWSPAFRAGHNTVN
jgi:hypothetical protein